MANPKNKWDQPAAPPAPMFFGKKERDLVKQVNDELSERIIGQPIAYYPISLEESNFNDTYGEAIEKVSLPPIRVYAFVSVENEQTNERYGYEYQSKLTINFNRRRLVEDQELYVRVGDFVQYGDLFYEIVKTYNDTRYYFGQVEHKFQISAECVRARQGAFTVTPSVTRPGERPTVSGEGDGPAPRPAPYPPLAASYITVNAETKLPNERILTAGSGITLTDAGSGGSLTIAAAGQNAIGPTGSLQIQAGAGTFYGNSNILFLTSSNILQVLGTLTASTEILTTTLSSSNINLVPTSGSMAGPGSYLALDSNNNVIVTSSLGGASIGGIFTTINGSQAYVTSSLAIGGTTAPDHQVSVSGSMSASVNISASAFYGDGSNLSGVTTSPATPVNSIQFNNASSFGGSANLTYNSSTNFVALSGAMAVSSSGDAALFRVDGATAGNVLFVTGSGRVGVNTAAPDATLEVVSSSADPSPSFRIKGTGPKLQFDEADAGAGKFQIAASNGMLKWQVQNSTFNDASVKWMMNSDGQMAFRDGAAGEAIPARIYISGSGNSNLLQLSSSTAADILVVTGSGRVGLGTAAPTSTLHIVGDVTASVALSSSVLRAAQLTSSYMNLAPASGTLAGLGSYLGLDTNNNVVVTSSAGGAGTPSSPLTSIQFNNGGAFGGSTNLTYDGSTLAVKGASHLSGGLIHKRTAVATNYTASVADYILGVTAVPVAIEFDATSFSIGQVVVIKDESGAASSGNTILLNASASQTLDGGTDATIESPYGSVLLYSDGANWFIY